MKSLKLKVAIVALVLLNFGGIISAGNSEDVSVYVHNSGNEISIEEALVKIASLLNCNYSEFKQMHIDEKFKIDQMKPDTYRLRFLKNVTISGDCYPEGSIEIIILDNA